MKVWDPVQFRGDYIHGEFVKPGLKSGERSNHSPSNNKELVFQYTYQNSHVDQAVDSARQAFPAWSKLSIAQRIETLLKVKEQFQKHEADFAEIIARETGKPLWDATTEAKALVSKFDVTFKDSLDLVKDTVVENALPQIRGMIRYRPRGVFAVLGPFNFPAHLPNGHIVPALVTGNTVVFKPSEMTPATAQLMAQCYHDAGLPPGVFNLIFGEAEVGRRLVSHKLVDGVLFTGSYETGLKIKEATLNDYWKILALEMGGKNSTIIWDDADMEQALFESLVGAFMSSGQRCSCTSRIFIHRSRMSEFTDKFYERAKKLAVGHWSEQPFMGALINEKSLDTYLRFQDIAIREGCEKIMRGKTIEPGVKGHYVTPSIYRVKEYRKDSVYQNTEIFGPNVALFEVEDLDSAVRMTNESGYGLAMAIFSKNRENYNYCLDNANVGLLNWNRTTNGASSRLPFGGRGKSGNDRPSAHFAVYYCTVPVASLEDEQAFDTSRTFPGMNHSLKL